MKPQPALSALLPPLLAVVLYLPALTAPFLVDERILFFEARKWLALDPLAPFQIHQGGSGTWRPLLMYLYWLDAGSPTWVSHLLQLLGHGALVWGAHRWLLLRLQPSTAALAALFFAAHSAHVATAGWVGGRADLAATGFVVVSLLAWHRGRTLLCAVAAVLAVLCKETALITPVFFALLWGFEDLGDSVDLRDGAGRARLRSLVLTTLCVAFAGFLSVAHSEVASSYWPSPKAWATAFPQLPLWGLELWLPWFRPLGVGEFSLGASDTLGAIAALSVACAAFLRPGSREQRRAIRCAVALVAASLLPVLHVLPNDGGQWYLLLPSLFVALAWGLYVDGGGRRRGILVLVVAVCALVTFQESLRWRSAAVEVERIIDEARQVEQEHGLEAVSIPPRQDPRNWPHLGPSFCCGLPYQLLEEAP